MSSDIFITEAARVLGVSVDTIRRWEKKGLIKAERNHLNQRVFNINELKKANQKYNHGAKSKKLQFLKSKDQSNFKVIELFCGAGGLALGMHNAGLQNVLLVDNYKNATETIKTNKKKWNVISGDVKNIDYKSYEADIVTGGFPCQAFSFAGNKLGFDDIRGTLFFELARAVKETKPKIALGENVKGLLRHDNGRTLKIMVDIMKDLGYRVKHKVLRSQYLDVPQKRERLIIVCLRDDLDTPFIFPKEKDYTISLREGLKNVPISEGQSYPDRKKEILSMIPAGGYWKDRSTR